MLLHHPSIHPSTYRWSNYGKSISFQSICACVSYYTLLAYRTSSYCFVQFLFLFYFLSFFHCPSFNCIKQTNQPRGSFFSVSLHLLFICSVSISIFLSVFVLFCPGRSGTLFSTTFTVRWMVDVGCWMVTAKLT